MKKVLNSIIATTVCLSMGAAPVFAEDSFSTIAQSAVDQMSFATEAGTDEAGTITLSVGVTDAIKELSKSLGFDISEVNGLKGIIGYDVSDAGLKANADIQVNDTHIVGADMYDNKETMYVSAPELADVLLKTESVLSQIPAQDSNVTAELYSNILSHVTDAEAEKASYINPVFTDEYTVYHGTVAGDEVKAMIIDVADYLSSIPGVETTDLEGFKQEINESQLPEGSYIDLGIWKGDDGNYNGFSTIAYLGEGESVAFYAMEDSTQMGRSLDVRLKGEGASLGAIDVSFSGSRTEESPSNGTYTLFYGNNDLLTVSLVNMELPESNSIAEVVSDTVTDGPSAMGTSGNRMNGLVSILVNGDPESTDQVVSTVGSLKGMKVDINVDVNEDSKDFAFDVSKDGTSLATFGLRFDKGSQIADIDSAMFESAVDLANAGEVMKGVDTIVQNLISAGISQETIQAIAGGISGTAE